MKECEQEKREITRLWRQYRATGRLEYRDALIERHLYLVRGVVGRMAALLPTHVKLEDLYSSGVTGLIRAVERFDVAKNRNFSSYASMVIKGAIIDDLRTLDWIPRSIHQKAHQITAAQQRLQEKLGREATWEELAESLQVPLEELEKLLEQIRPAILIPLNGVREFEEESASMEESIPDAQAKTSYEIAQHNETIDMVKEAIEQLPEQERRVLYFYYYEDRILKDIGNVLGISESRVSQIHAKALLRLRHRMVKK